MKKKMMMLTALILAGFLSIKSCKSKNSKSCKLKPK